MFSAPDNFPLRRSTRAASQIIPTCEEMYAGCIEFAQAVIQKETKAQRKR